MFTSHTLKIVLMVCLPKKEGGSGLFDIKVGNRSFLAKQLCNVNSKTDSHWIQ
jgi:hypothetical protein